MLKPIECAMIGTQNSTLSFVTSVLGMTFSIVAELSFAGNVIRQSDCRGITSLCEDMFVVGSNYVLLNNTNPTIMFGDLSTFYLRDIAFEIQSATGANPLHYTMSNPPSDVSDARKIHAILEWRQPIAKYRLCKKDDGVAKFATITDPWVFTEIRQEFLGDMCVGVDYA